MPEARDDSLVFDVEGMTCATCALRIERILERQDGVDEVTVNFAGQEARVKVREGVSRDALQAAVAKLGYTIEPARAGDQRSIVERYSEESRMQARNAMGAGLLTVPLAVIAMAIGHDGALGWVQAVLATPVVFWFGRQFHRNAWIRLRSFGANMDTLVSVGTLAAYGFSLWSLLTSGDVFFETAAIIITFILLGRYLEARAKGRASGAVTALLRLAPDEATVLRATGPEVVPVGEVSVGDRLVVAPGGRVPADGVVLEGASSVDESMLTGESIPVDKAPGSSVVGGTINLQSRLIVEATGVGGDTALARIVRLVEEAQASRAPVQRLADRVAGVFVPVVIVIAVATLVGWLAFGNDTGDAIRAAVAVLIVACPCALGLATPTAIMVGSGRAAERGILFRSAEALERANDVTTVAFDKTGTLTQGAMTLADMVPDDREALRLAAAIEVDSGHPVGKAVALGADEAGIDIPPAQTVEALGGLGVRGEVDGVAVMAGKPKLFADSGWPVPGSVLDAMAEMEGRGETAFVVGWGGEGRAAMSVSDELRPEASSAIRRLREDGRAVAMITGDNIRTAETVAGALGVERVLAEVLPAEKADEISRLAGDGAVAFVGDGVNDAPALAAADVGIAIGAGTDVAIETADVVLMGGAVTGVVDALDVASATVRVIRQNLFWAFVYNVAAIPLAAAGLLNPMIAAAAMALSSVSVVTNSLRLRRA